jgi:hypothetical protein
MDDGCDDDGITAGTNDGSDIVGTNENGDVEGMAIAFEYTVERS